MLFVVFALLAGAADVNYTDLVVGKWTVTMVQLDETGREFNPPSPSFMVEMTGTEESGVLEGEILGEDEEGVPVPVGKAGFVLEEGTNNTFRFLLAADSEAETLEDVTSFTLENGVDDVCVTMGKTSNDQLYSLNVLSVNVVEVTLYDKETKGITIFRCLKEPKPAQKGSMWSMLLPMLPMLISTFMNRGSFGAPAAAPADGNAVADKKND